MSYRYIGNKAQISDPIVKLVSSYVGAGSRVADPMCGTAAMSASFRAANLTVTASDLLTFAKQHAQVRLLLDGAPTFDGLGQTYEDVLSHLNRLPPETGLFAREYSPGGTPTAGFPPRQYFTDANAEKIDAIRKQINTWSGKLTPLEGDLLHHDLVLAANRVANIAGTYGHFRSSWSSSALRSIELTPTHFDSGPTTGHIVMQGRVEDVASEISADACYLDPPYMKRQYAANYHILETLARGDDPDAVGASGLRNWWDQYSDFCSKRKIADAFAATFNKMDCDLFFVSYSEDGLITSSEMLRLFEEFGEVKRFDIPNKRFKSNRGGVGGVVTEYVYVVSIR
jgi:adenine-specific DNA-methyltransferase